MFREVKEKQLSSWVRLGRMVEPGLEVDWAGGGGHVSGEWCFFIPTQPRSDKKKYKGGMENYGITYRGRIGHRGS